MNWKVFPGACAAPYWTTCVRIINTTGHPAEISIVFGPYKVDKIAIQPGEIAFDLRDLAKWNFFIRPEPGQKGIVEGCLYVEEVPGIEVYCQVEHIHCWIGARVPEAGRGIQRAPAIIPLQMFEYSGDAPCGKNYGRVGGSEGDPFYGPGNVI